MKEPIINQVYFLDLGSSHLIEVKVRSVDENYVYVEYMSSWAGRTEKFSRKDWEFFA